MKVLAHIVRILKDATRHFSLAFIVYFIVCLPSTLFTDGYSKVLQDRNGQLLEARIANDGQWRFPIIDSVPVKFITCIKRYEDQNFHIHPGVDPSALVRAAYLNYQAGEVVSGGSTLTMQTIRLLRKNKSRTILEKCIEMVWASRLEVGYSKDEILKLYASHAPFGGNVVGLETASWRYFNRSPENLSWAETAMLAVLPNSPGLIHVNKNRPALRKKRNQLLSSMYNDGLIDEVDYNLAIDEPLPNPLNSLPHHSYHLINRFHDQGRIHSTIDLHYQKQFNAIMASYADELKRMNTHNLSAVLIDIKKGEVLAYVGNHHKNNNEHAGKVDMLSAVRSSGSILKPLLYGKAIDVGMISPKQIIPDYPMNFTGYRPVNYTGQFDGMVSARQALFRSLNVPAVWMLSNYGNARFKSDLQQLGMTSITRPASNYGLSLILGGAEVNLLELTSSYASLANKLNGDSATAFQLHLTLSHSNPVVQSNYIYSSGSAYATLDAITNTYRPETESFWRSFSSSQRIAWKTGTSFGNRDAWAVGVTADYAIGVWVGNSDGEGIAEMTGLKSAAPLLFQLFETVPKSDWFERPYEMTTTRLCTESGMKKGEFCPRYHQELLPASSEKASACTYHKTFLTTEEGKHRAYKNCGSGKTKLDTFLVLSPIVSHYYQKRHPHFQSLPPWSSDCVAHNERLNVQYPINNGRISLPKGNQSEKGVTAKAYYSNKEGELFWELNGQFIGTTSAVHHKIIEPQKGKNELVITDADGFVSKTKFEVI